MPTYNGFFFFKFNSQKSKEMLIKKFMSNRLI